MGYAGQLIVERSAEELLLEFERTGRPEPFEEIVRRYSGMVYHVCHRICRDKHDAEDATQAVFAALAVGRKKESGEIRTIGPWLRQVARRVSLDIRRGKKRRQRRETLCASDGASVDPMPEPSQGGLDAEEVKQLVKEELERMPVKYRLPLILHYFGGMSQDDMAKELGCRPGTLRVRLHRARNMLGKRLAKRGVAVGGMMGAVVFAVAVTRAVQSAVTDSLAVQFGYGHAATAGGVIQAATSGSMAVAHGVVASKVKVGCALLLIGACVVRAGAEVYEYIRPMQLRVPMPVNLDQIMRPLFDTFVNPIRVDATPGGAERPGEAGGERRSEVAIENVKLAEPVLAEPPAAPVVGPVTGVGVGGRQGVGAPVDSAVVDRAGRSGGADVVLPPPGWVGPEYARPMVWTPAPLPSTGGGSGGASGRSVGELPPVASRPTAPVVPPKKPPTQKPGNENDVTPNKPPSSDPPVESPVAEQQPPQEEVPPPIAGGTQNSQVTPPSSSGGQAPAVASAIVIGPNAPVEFVAPVKAASVAYDNVVAAGSAPMFLALSTTPTVNLESAHAVSFPAADFWRVSTPTRTFRVEEKGISGYGVVAAASVDNSGIVTASSGTLDLSQVGGVGNSVENPPKGRNGWYAEGRSRLVLPKIRVKPGANAYSWGEDPDDATPDLVNSVRMTMPDVTAEGEVQVSLVSQDWPGVPAFPPGQRVFGIWSIDSGGIDLGAIDLLIRFDAYKAFNSGYLDQDIRLLGYRNGWSAVDDDSFAIDPDGHLVRGRVRDVTYFAVVVPTMTATATMVTIVQNGSLAYLGYGDVSITPEPTGVGLAVGGMFLLLGRRRRKM